MKQVLFFTYISSLLLAAIASIIYPQAFDRSQANDHVSVPSPFVHYGSISGLASS